MTDDLEKPILGVKNPPTAVNDIRGCFLIEFGVGLAHQGGECHV
jgi:hypothetical protein